MALCWHFYCSRRVLCYYVRRALIAQFPFGPGGEIGRHRRLKISRSLRSYRFDSGPGHQKPSGLYPLLLPADKVNARAACREGGLGQRAPIKIRSSSAGARSPRDDLIAQRLSSYSACQVPWEHGPRAIARGAGSHSSPPPFWERGLRAISVTHTQINVGDGHRVVQRHNHGHGVIRAALGVGGAGGRVVAGAARIVELPVAVSGALAGGLL